MASLSTIVFSPSLAPLPPSLSCPTPPPSPQLVLTGKKHLRHTCLKWIFQESRNKRSRWRWRKVTYFKSTGSALEKMRRRLTCGTVLSGAVGKFLRRFRLPENAKMDQIKAAMENGVLIVTVPKEEVKKSDVKAI